MRKTVLKRAVLVILIACVAFASFLALKAYLDIANIKHSFEEIIVNKNIEDIQKHLALEVRLETENGEITFYPHGEGLSATTVTKTAF